MTQRDEHLSAEHIQAFLDGELSQGDMAHVQGHAAVCVRCQAEIEAWRLLFDELEDLPTLEPSPGLVQRVMGALPRRVAVGLGHRQPAEPSGGHLDPNRIQEYLEHGLSTAALTRVETHLAACGRCRSEVAGWQAMFVQLEGLDALEPSVGFAEGVLARMETRTPLGLLARFRRGAAREHLSPERVQELLESHLGTRDTRRAEVHVAACDSCRTSLQGWQTLFSELESLAELAPSEGFGERVMARVRVRAPVTAPAPVPSVRIRRWLGGFVPQDVTGALAAFVGRLVPRSRRARAFLVSVAATPTIAVAVVAAFLFSHPLLTPGYLASYLWWQASAAMSGLVGRVVSGGIATWQGLLGNGLLDALAGSAVGLLITGVVFTAIMGLSLLVLYRNLFAPSVNERHARILS